MTYSTIPTLEPVHSSLADLELEALGSQVRRCLHQVPILRDQGVADPSVLLDTKRCLLEALQIERRRPDSQLRLLQISEWLEAVDSLDLPTFELP
jgi:hypothetical protein